MRLRSALKKQFEKSKLRSSGESVKKEFHTQTFHAKTIEDLSIISKELQKILAPQTVILLEGELGAGKTELVKSLLKQMGYVDTSSPTFSIINEYTTIPRVYHVDLYRLKDNEDIESTGLWDLFAEKEALIIIEWSQRLQKSEIPRRWKTISVTISTTISNDRKIIISS